MAERWTLHRAGIVNVYQYGDEVLHFAGGRLLLRGLNGSGKSTAMNMLLPFLLEGDPRRIDAAGEQSGVLRSWMLEGREDAQPIGYLWLELIRGDEAISFGCGIKANRATDGVTTWWWITSRRPKIDLDLVQGRHPLSAEALRGVLDPDPVFRQEDRPRYRQELRRRLYGGSDLDQHLRLLHIVRNPRVGDRIDIELPGHLHEALPQLSEEALAEAAQPLDDLDEHRHNVNELRRTATTLDAMGEVYAQYARGRVHVVAAQLKEVASGAEQAGRRAARAQRQLQQAVANLEDLARRAAELEGDHRRMETELASLRDAPAYREGTQLEDLRRHVHQLERDVGRTQEGARRAEVSLSERAADVSRAGKEAGDDHRALGGRIRDLQVLIVPAGLAAGAPDLPPAPQANGEDLGVAPPIPAQVAPIQQQLEHVRVAVRHRAGDIKEVRAHLAEITRAEQALATAERALARAHAERQTRGDRHVELARALATSAVEWRQALEGWIVTVGEVSAAPGLMSSEWPDLDRALIDRRHDIAVALRSEADRITDHHAGVAASLSNSRVEAAAGVARLQAVVQELDEREVPPPSAQAWQRGDRRRVLAELVDFRKDVQAVDRAGLEAALEASGLLGAEVGEDGALQVGELVVVAEGQAERPLAGLLTAVAAPGGPDLSRTEALLGAISVDPAHIREGSTSSVAVVTTDGRFRIGPVSGRHTKPVAEHVGLTARRQALERAREAARLELGTAQADLARIEQSLTSAEAQLRSVRTARDALPSTASLEGAVASERQGALDLRAAEEHLDDQVLSHRAQEEAYAKAVDLHRRTAANLGLPLTADALVDVDTGLGHIRELSGSIDAALTIWVRSMQAWQAAAARWRDAVEEEARAGAEVVRSLGALAPLAARLATLEDSIGVEYAEILRTMSHLEGELATVEEQRTGTAKERLTATATAASLRKEAEQEERGRDRELARCAEVLRSARAHLTTPGLLAAATPSGAAVAAPVEPVPSGLSALAGAIEETVPRPTQAEVSADSVRASLRQRRDALGAGYDAEDRQAEDQWLSVEINGPTGRFPLVEAISVVGARLAELSALLSAEQDTALRELLEGLIATEVAEKLHGAEDLVDRMNRRLDVITTSHGIGVTLRWRRRDDLDAGLGIMIDLLGVLPQLRSEAQDEQLRSLLSERLADARLAQPDLPYRALIGEILDYRNWYQTALLLRRPGHPPERLTKRTKLSEGEKKIVSYLPLFAAVAASCDAIGEQAPDAPRFLLLDDAFAKVSEDNHAKLFGLLVDLDLDFIATSERLWGTHATVPELAITEVIRDASLGAIVLEHSRWDGRAVTSS